jgi:hypothetical protein
VRVVLNSSDLLDRSGDVAGKPTRGSGVSTRMPMDALFQESKIPTVWNQCGSLCGFRSSLIPRRRITLIDLVL